MSGWAFQVAQLIKTLPAMQETWFDSWVGKFPWRRDRLPTPVFLGFPGGSDSEESAYNARDLGSIPEVGKSPGEGHGNHSSILAWRIPMDRGAWRATAHGVTKSQTRLSDLAQCTGIRWLKTLIAPWSSALAMKRLPSRKCTSKLG